MGKWDDVVKTLPKYNGNDPTYQKVVDQVKLQVLAPKESPTTEVKAIEDALKAIKAGVEVLCGHLANDYRTQYATTFATAYERARFFQEVLEKHAKALGVFRETYTQLFDSQLENEGATSVKLEGGLSVRIQAEPHSTVEDPAKFNAWCRENGYESEMSLLWQTMNAAVKERLENGEDIPPGIKVWNKRKIVPVGREKVS